MEGEGEEDDEGGRPKRMRLLWMDLLGLGLVVVMFTYLVVQQNFYRYTVLLLVDECVVVFEMMCCWNRLTQDRGTTRGRC